MTTFTPCNTCPSAAACERWGYCNAEAMREGEGKAAIQVLGEKLKEFQDARDAAPAFTREDFEMAAKAAGLDISQGRTTEDGIFWFTPDRSRFARVWNPRDDAGDALRLAVALGLKVDVHRLFPFCGWERPWVEVFGYESRRVLATAEADDNGASLQVATCHAIFRAAITIGRAMP